MSPRNRLLGILGGAFVSLALVTALLRNLLQPREHRFQIPATSELTEQVALEFTKEALEVEGKSSPGMLPRPYRDNDPANRVERLFARNTLDPLSGYVIWRVPQQGHVVEYGVSIEKRGTEILCTVHRSK